jgi:ankyrin repeat protein
MTALHLAALHGKTEIADIIITHLVENQFKHAYVQEIISKINDQINMSPLSLAILYGHEEIATKLITNGAKCYFDNNAM